MGDGGEGADKDGSDGAGTCDDVKVGGSDSTTLQERELSSDGGDAESTGGFPPMGCPLVDS